MRWRRGAVIADVPIVSGKSEIMDINRPLEYAST
jgi:hypothetical protein